MNKEELDKHRRMLIELNKELKQENKQLKEKIDKAIEKLKKGIFVIPTDTNELLEILGDKKNE